MLSQTMRRRDRDEDAGGSECTNNGWVDIVVVFVLMKNHGDVCVCVCVCVFVFFVSK